MSIETMSDDEFKPACPKCSGIDFAVVNNAYVQRASFAIPMVICANLQCQTVVGVIQKKSVWEK